VYYRTTLGEATELARGTHKKLKQVSVELTSWCKTLIVDLAVSKIFLSMDTSPSLQWLPWTTIDLLQVQNKTKNPWNISC
jgi:hypothetical protein